jgi:site-specific DNA-adenine methylase
MANEIISLFPKFKNDRNIYIEPFVGGANIIDKVKGFIYNKWL